MPPVELGLEGRGCLVTGGTAGIGLATAQALARAGALVAVAGRDAERAAAVAADLVTLGASDAVGIGADLATAAGCEQAVAAASERFEGLDVLVNNVGAARSAQWWEVDDTAWMRTFELNVMAYVRCTRAALAHLRASSQARIVNVASTSGKRPSTGMPDYSVTKAAVLSFSRLLADAHAKEGILVNAICPGPSLTEAWVGEGGLADQTAARAGTSREQVLVGVGSGRPAGRMAEPGEIADVAVLLCSARASFVVGAAWSVDGGSVPVIL
jgi:NAD(P)-dependent dehydrogenase (short-subunit alcohol dehydrogenase family)